MGKSRKKYTREFKLEAVRLVVDQGHAAKEIARDLGINESLLHQWKRRLRDEGALAFPGNGRAAGGVLERENQELRKELARVKQEREILKKAAVESTDRRNTLCSMGLGEEMLANGSKGKAGTLRFGESASLGKVEERTVTERYRSSSWEARWFDPRCGVFQRWYHSASPSSITIGVESV